MNEECIIRKLVADGDGVGDDRRFVTILSLLVKVIKEPESSKSVLPRIMKIVDAAENAMKKQMLIFAMNERQIQEYAMLTAHIEQEIVKANEKMSTAKKELCTAKGMRKNKEEYELLAKMIEKIPSRPETARKLEIIKKELEELHEKQRNLEAKLFRLFSIRDINERLASLIAEEENDETMNNVETSDGTTTETKKEKA